MHHATLVGRRTHRTAGSWSAALALVCSTACVDTFPLPDEFDAAFVTGTVCMPSSVRTGTSQSGGAPEYPLRIETCAYRCIDVDRSTVSIRNHWVCLAGQCEMVLLATAHVLKASGQDDCDARDLPDPPSSQCTVERFEFTLSPPCCIDEGSGPEYLNGDVRVTVPYLDLDQGQRVVDRINQGESPSTVIEQEVGRQNYPSRQFIVNFDPGHPEVQTHDELGPETCHDIPAP
jgi:hypothetical protein